MQEIALARAARAFAEQQHRHQQQAHANQQPPPAATQAGLEELALSALDRVLIVKAGSLPALKEALAALERQVPQLGAKLVVLDSVAALLRAELGGGGRQAALERSELVGRQAAALKALAERHRIPVVVTNQVRRRGPAKTCIRNSLHMRTRHSQLSPLAAAVGSLHKEESWLNAPFPRLPGHLAPQRPRGARVPRRRRAARRRRGRGPPLGGAGHQVGARRQRAARAGAPGGAAVHKGALGVAAL